MHPELLESGALPTTTHLYSVGGATTFKQLGEVAFDTAWIVVQPEGAKRHTCTPPPTICCLLAAGCLRRCAGGMKEAHRSTDLSSLAVRPNLLTGTLREYYHVPSR